MTTLSKWHDVVNEGEEHTTYTHDSWVIPETGTDIWCTAWKRGQTIKPYGDGCHVVIGFTVYHCDEIMDILLQLEKEGHTWGVAGVEMMRKQQIKGEWTPIKMS